MMRHIRKNASHPSVALPKQIVKCILLLLTALFSFADPEARAQSNSPNVILIVADDLGYGDLGCYGQRRINTPNIDRLADEGLRFTNYYAGAPVCAPSRSALMTGLHTGHTFIRGNKEVQPEGQWPIPHEAFTLTEMMKSAGYITGVFGKWGLGSPGSEGSPERQGVDTFFGYNCQRLAHNYYPEYLWENTRKVALPGNLGAAKEQYAPSLIHEQALNFIETHRRTPFFLLYAMITPHAELAAPEKNMKKYRGKFLPEKHFDGIDAGEPGFRNGPYGSQAEAHAAFAAMIDVMDNQVGSILAKLAGLGIEENTLIIFTSDNGPHLEGGADPDYFNSNGPLRGYKRDVYEGGIRVPMIARWKGVIVPGRESEHPSAFWDLMPTLAELLNVEQTQPLDGISLLPTLQGKKDQRQHDYLYWEFHEKAGSRALRRHEWKLIQNNVGNNPGGGLELYNLEEDPSEEVNLASQHPEKVKELFNLMVTARVPSPAFPFGADR